MKIAYIRQWESKWTSFIPLKQHKYEEYDTELDLFLYLQFYHGTPKVLCQKDGGR